MARTLHGRIMSVVMLTCVATSLVTGVAFVAYEWVSLKERQAQELQSVTQLLASQVQGSLLYDKPKLAAHDMAILNAVPFVREARLYKGNTVFASYDRAQEAQGPWQIPGLDHQRQEFSLPMINDGQPFGRLVLVADYSSIQGIVAGFAIKGLITLLLALLLAWGLSVKLNDKVLRPIVALINAARKISRDHDYRLRVEMVELEELGVLIDAFNHMLSEVQSRTAEAENIKNYLYDVIDAMPSALAGIDKDCRIIYFNHQACTLSAVPFEQAIGQNLFEVLPFLRLQQSLITHTVQSKQIGSSERFVVDSAGVSHYYVLTVYPLSEDEGAVVRLDNVTEQVHLEEQLIQNEKMLSVGGLAAGMAHEINNPLGGMMQGAQNIERRLKIDLPANQAAAKKVGLDLHQLEDYLKERQIDHFLKGIRGLGQRVAGMVHTMLQFSRKTSSAQAPVAVEKLFDEAIELARNDKRLTQVQISVDIETGLPAVMCNASEIEQVLVNLLRNAAHAMADDATLTPSVTLKADADDRFLKIIVEDNGPGIPEEILSKIFEPFFTTKDTGQGTGLGLSLSYFIICTRHQGKMWVESVRGEGARFHIQLPLSGIEVLASDRQH